MKIFRSVCFSTMGFLFLLPLAFATEPQFTIQMKPNRTVKVGENCQLDVEVAWKSKDADYRFAPSPLTLENLAVEESGETNETFQKEGEEWKKKTFRFKLHATQKGKGRIRPFQVGYLDPQTASAGHFEVGEMEISIAPDRTPLYRFLLEGTAVTTLGALGGWWLVARMRKKQLAAPVAEPTLEDRYLSQLGVTSDKISEAGRHFRTYLVEKFSVRPGGATNRELLAVLQSRLSGEELKNLRKIFDKLDECRFGTASRSPVEQQQLHREMVHFVEGKKII